MATSKLSLGRALSGLDRADEAEALFGQALQIRENVLGADHPKVASTARLLALLLDEQGRLAEAEPHYRRTLKIWEATWSDGHPNVGVVSNELAALLVQQGKLEEADAHYRRALKIWEEASNSNDVDLADTLLGLALIGLSRGEDIEAVRAHAERATSIREGAEVHPTDVAQARFVLARALWSDETQRDRALELTEHAREVFAQDGEYGESNLAELERWLAERRPQ